MRLHELDITNMRGIKDVSLKPAGKNFVVTGRNGTGKSAVVDAIDFLLTGRIQRLRGKGTGGITLKLHGPHIDSKPEEATVRAVVSVPGYAKQFEISRSLSSADILVCPDEARTKLLPVLELAARGQHVLSRREILRYITSDPGDRANEIQSLLNLSDVEETRRALVKAHNELKKESSQADAGLKVSHSALATAANLVTVSDDELLSAVNTQRAILGGEPLASLSSQLKNGLREPAAQPKTSINLALLQSDYKQLCDLMDEDNVSKRVTDASLLLAGREKVLNDASLMQLAGRLKLAEMGSGLVDDSDKCPLCDTQWKPGELISYLEAKVQSAKAAFATLSAIDGCAERFLEDLRRLKSIVERVVVAASVTKDADVCSNLEAWVCASGPFESALTSPFVQASSAVLSDPLLPRLGISEAVMSEISKMVGAQQKVAPTVSPEQIAWDVLTRIESHFIAWHKASVDAASARASYDRATALVESFEVARDETLSQLYEIIKNRFVGLYRMLHRSDESTFDALLKPDGAGLAFQVDFYGKGNHPPHALHSEGHQDSMGLCLYLALAEYLNSSVIDLVVLDDVVMSVDAEHRRELCRLITEHFPSKQFVITTHDRAWAGQLRTEGTVTSGNTYTFYNWSVDHGPYMDHGTTEWSTIEDDLSRDDVHRAAHALRHGLEAFFRQTASALNAQVPYNIAERWDLGHFLHASIRQMKTYLSKAKAACNSWGDEDKLREIDAYESNLNNAIQKSQVEQWAVNTNVHYNNWANFGKQDFAPVVQVMRDLCTQFTCTKCGGVLQTEFVGLEARTVRCACGSVMVNLTKKADLQKPALS